MCQQQNQSNYEIARNLVPQVIEDAEIAHEQLKAAKRLFISADALSENAEVRGFIKDLAKLNYRGAKLVLTSMTLKKSEWFLVFTAEEMEKLNEILSRPIPQLED